MDTEKYSSIYFVAQVLVPYRFCTNGKQPVLYIWILAWNNNEPAEDFCKDHWIKSQGQGQDGLNTLFTIDTKKEHTNIKAVRIFTLFFLLQSMLLLQYYTNDLNIHVTLYNTAYNVNKTCHSHEDTSYCSAKLNKTITIHSSTWPITKEYFLYEFKKESQILKSTWHQCVPYCIHCNSHNSECSDLTGTSGLIRNTRSPIKASLWTSIKHFKK